MKLGRGSCLLLVDIQRDLCSGGAFPVPDGDAVVQVLNRWIEQARAEGVLVVASRDWHPAGHVSFEESGGPWPPHCLQDTGGAAFPADLELPADAIIISKGTQTDRDTYSAFDANGLAERLQAAGIRRLWVGGLALDYCVLATVLDGLRMGFEVHLIRAATRAMDVRPGDGEAALAQMIEAGAVIEEGA